MAKEIVRCDAIDRVHMALDYFDAGIKIIKCMDGGIQKLAESTIICALHTECGTEKITG